RDREDSGASLPQLGVVRWSRERVPGRGRLRVRADDPGVGADPRGRRVPPTGLLGPATGAGLADALALTAAARRALRLRGAHANVGGQGTGALEGAGEADRADGLPPAGRGALRAARVDGQGPGADDAGVGRAVPRGGGGREGRQGGPGAAESGPR